MPGKVNPSVPEMVNQVCFQVMGCDTTVALACEAGQLELNVMMPVIAWNALHASTILREAMKALRDRDASTASPPTRRARASCSIAARRRATALSPYIGYAATAEIAKESVADRPIDPRARARARPARRDAARRDPVGRGDDARRDHREQEGQEQAGRAGEGGQGMSRVRAALTSRCRDGHSALPVLRRPARPARPVRLPPTSPTQPRSRPRSAVCSAPQDLGLLEAPDRDQWQKPDQIMDALGIADGVGRRRPRRGRRLVHDPAGSPRRAERPRLRRGHPAADDRGDRAAAMQREGLANVRTGARHADRSAAAAGPRRGAHRRRVSRDGRCRRIRRSS